MPLEQALIDLMLEEITLEPATGKDKYGMFTYDPPYTAGPTDGKVRCKITRMNKRTIDIQGQETTTTVQCILSDPTLVVTVNDRLTLPDGEVPAIIGIMASMDDEGPYWLEILA